MPSTRYSIKLGGESGQGINTLGQLLSKALKDIGYQVFAYREYPSLIKGGIASYQVDFSQGYIASSTAGCSILAVLSQSALHNYIHDVTPNGIIIYDNPGFTFTQEEDQWLLQNNIKKILLDSNTIATEAGGSTIMSNIVITGFIWHLLGLNLPELSAIIKETFNSKGEDIVNKNIACLNAGYNSSTFKEEYSQIQRIPQPILSQKDNKTLTGNDALALGAIACGVRAYFAYPMTPATSIFKMIGETYKETGILVKQAESEITAIQMTMGAMAMGTRALTATSGGGFDLMQETISCAGITETPLVIVFAQRIGAGTGVPTWTGAGDIHTAVKSGHGEFPKVVISVSDVPSAYVLIQQAFNIAEKYQMPVIILTEKHIAESLFTVKTLPTSPLMDRGFFDGENRYEITETGISPRWMPEFDKKPYLQNSDEHNSSSLSIEDPENIKAMSDKRMRKLETLKKDLPKPVLFGNPNCNTILVGNGSVKNPILDAISLGKDIAYLHYEYIYPTDTEILLTIANQGKRIILIENNQTGDFGKVLTEASGYQFKEKMLKYDGRPFFLDDILNIQI